MIGNPNVHTWQCDWTHWQGPITDPFAFEREGYGVVNLKVGGAKKEGWTYIDPVFQSNLYKIQQTTVQPMCFWYLMPNRGAQQAALMWHELEKAGGPEGLVIELDVEEPNLLNVDVRDWVETWNILSGDYPFKIYTRANVWHNLGLRGPDLTPFLQVAHYVPPTVYNDPAKPYASQQYKDVPAPWWDQTFGDWNEILSLQFTPHAKVNQLWVPVSRWRMTQQDIRTQLVIA